MTTTRSEARTGLTWQVPTLALLLLLTVEADPATAAAIKTASKSSAAAPWLRSTAVFLVVAVAGGYVWYFGLFPRLLRKASPSWPLDAWRQSTSGAWVTACLATLVFRKPLMDLLTPYLKGVLPGTLSNTLKDSLSMHFMELVLIPLAALVGLVVIWNFRRDAANRSRPA